MRSTVREDSKFCMATVEGCNLLPLTRYIFSDHLMLALVYRCLLKEDNREAPSFLFKSIKYGFEGPMW